MVDDIDVIIRRADAWSWDYWKVLSLDIDARIEDDLTYTGLIDQLFYNLGSLLDLSPQVLFLL